jgi:hypothetical protein
MLEMPKEFYGELKASTEFVKSVPRAWTDNELQWCVDSLQAGFSVKEIANAIGRTEISVQTKLKRKTKTGDSYNDKNRGLKYAANQFFIDTVQPKTVLDVYAGNSFYKTVDGLSVVTNDKDEKFDTDYSLDALRLLCVLYADGKKFDVVDIDPYGSAYECFDLALKMSRKGIVVSFGEWGHKRWKRYDFVRPRYGVSNGDEFVPEAFISEFQRIARVNHKEAVVVDVLQYGNFLRVYFTLEKFKTVEQWDIDIDAEADIVVDGKGNDD